MMRVNISVCKLCGGRAVISFRNLLKMKRGEFGPYCLSCSEKIESVLNGDDFNLQSSKDISLEAVIEEAENVVVKKIGQA